MLQIRYFIQFCFWAFLFGAGLKTHAAPIHVQEQENGTSSLVQQNEAPSKPSSEAGEASTPGTEALMGERRGIQYKTSSWYIKSNLVYDALLMPSLEVEYRFNESWSAAVEGNIAWWHNDGKHQCYQLATIIPEARWWFKPQGDRRGHYVGIFGGGGWYDLENKKTGYKGTGGMVGISYGYMFPVGKYLAFEAGAGVGYMHAKYEEYYPIEGHYVYQQTSRTNFFGPLKLKFALVWNIGRWLEKGGNK